MVDPQTELFLSAFGFGQQYGLRVKQTRFRTQSIIVCYCYYQVVFDLCAKTDYYKLYIYIAFVCYLNTCTGSFVKLMNNVANPCELDDNYHDFRISMNYRGSSFIRWYQFSWFLQNALIHGILNSWF